MTKRVERDQTNITGVKFLLASDQIPFLIRAKNQSLNH